MSAEKRLLAFVVSEEADQIFLHLDRAGVDMRLKILENVDLIERAVNIRRKFPQV